MKHFPMRSLVEPLKNVRKYLILKMRAQAPKVYTHTNVEKQNPIYPKRTNLPEKPQSTRSTSELDLALDAREKRAIQIVDARRRAPASDLRLLREHPAT